MTREHTITNLADFALVDYCVACGRQCDWQPRFERATRSPEHAATLALARPALFKPEPRVVKICSDCVPSEDFEGVRKVVLKYYPEATF